MSSPEIKVLADAASVAHEAAERIVEWSEAAIETGGRFSVALSGGSTPQALFALLASPSYQPQIDWPNIDVFFADERCVPPDHADSNYRLARDTLLSRVPLPGDNVYRMRGELTNPNEAAKEYGEMLKDKFGDGGLDLVLLGMGDDGHTASLFPGTAAVEETRHRCVANHVKKLNAWRLTLTAPFINRSAAVMFLVTGAGKAARVSEVLEGAPEGGRLPAQLIRPNSGKLTWLLDAAAAGMED
jgi:6-phosphogluconolactonase